MTIKLTGDEFWEQFQEAEEEQLQRDPSDKLDITYKFDTRLSQGWKREIDLREGLSIYIDHHHPHERFSVNFYEMEYKNIVFWFVISGHGQENFAFRSGETLFPVVTGKYYLMGNGLRPQINANYLGAKPYSFVGVYILPSALCSFISSLEKALPENLQHLIGCSTKETYMRCGETQPMMTKVLQQILNCPYRGIVKRTYLESKSIELVALVLDHEITLRQGKNRHTFLKPEQLDKVRYAKEILLRDLSNPPSLESLTQRTGLNDFALRQGFRQVFGTTVFGQLQAHRLEVAKQLLAEQDISVTEVAHRVGYASLPSFTKAFKRKFGITPKAHQKACR
ncbi:MAG: AraC family transcriptional regulator [Cyanobacteria bacterium J06649_5]